MSSYKVPLLAILFIIIAEGFMILIPILLTIATTIYISSKDDTKNIKTRNFKQSKVIKPDLNKLKKITKKKKILSNGDDLYSKNTNSLKLSPIFIFYSSLTGSSKKFAIDLDNKLKSENLNSKILSIDEDIEDLDSYFVNISESEYKPIYILILPSYESDSPIDYFLEFLEETKNDFRINKYPLKKLSGFTVLGLGDSESWPELFCYQSEIADKLMSKLGGRRLFPLGKLCIKNDFKNKSESWINKLIDSINDDEPFIYEKYDKESLNYDKDSSDEEEEYEIEIDDDLSSDDQGTLVDMEDLSNNSNSKSKQKINSNGNILNSNLNKRKEMVAKNSPTYKSLTKQGYTIVGSHSGVKICRWTKSALRGRGFCYKFAFYGINSHRCMESTPSLSCSSKCVFCWRHGSNPVGTKWRWEVDKPDIILNGILNGHYSKIKQMRGIPGILMDRFEEAFEVKHCALSLVGEPIFYPYINELMNLLHEKEISTFLVCNAQHPDQLKKLCKVTQLYVSIDAPTKEELKIIDRPLFRDYWERLESCLDLLRTIQSHQRTVYRLTLVKGFNMNEKDIGGYANIVERGNPSLIEIKGATFCGSSDGNGNPLTMQNIPFYEECVLFVKKLNDELNNRGLNYGLAAEHSHSCCFLIANKKFLINNEWYTHIDYTKFFKLLKSGESFDSMDYISKTPEWAYFGSEQGGFNPQDTRYIRKDEKLKKKLAREAEAKANDLES